MVPNVIVRTVSGDVTQGKPHPIPDEIAAELGPWYNENQSVGTTLHVELGNEPNMPPWQDNPPDEQFVWDWRYWLEQSINRVQRDFPGVATISPGFVPGRNPDPFYRIAGDQIRRCSYVGFHMYEYHSYNQIGTNDINIIINHGNTYFPHNYWFITEHGINDPHVGDWSKGVEYAGAIHCGQSYTPLPWQVAGATYYHLQRDSNGHHLEYDIYPDGDSGYNYKRFHC
jgi:hypothetical protein